MGRPADPNFGPEPPADRTGAPFSVTGPPSITLDSSRHGLASFVVTNTSGHPVIARLLPQGLDGAEAAWLTLVGDIERPLGVDATLTAEVEVEVPADAPAGQKSMRLDVAVEEAPDRVTTGQTVSFAVPEESKKRFPMWILAVVVVALVVIGVGAWLIVRLTGDDNPQATAAPTISGTAEIGSELTVNNGAWEPADVTLLHRWQACPADADPAQPQGCADITVASESDTAAASGTSHVVGADQEGLRLRVVEVAVIGDLEALEEGASADLAELPQAASASALTDVVPPAPVAPIVVPGVTGLTYSQASATLAEAGLQVLWTRVGAGGSCDPLIEAQNPVGGQEADLGAAVAVTTKEPPPIFECLQFPVKEIPDLTFDLPEVTFP